MIELNIPLSTAEAELFRNACSQFSPRTIRLRDDISLDVIPFDTLPVNWYSRGRTLVDPQLRPSTFLNYPANDYYIQDAGSLLPIELLSPRRDELILDLCAAPGGKASAILEDLGGTGFLVANEAIRGRLDSLRTVLGRTGFGNYAVCNHDPDQLAMQLGPIFDAVLVDAPCSGQMLVSKEKRDENAWSPKQIAHSSMRQSRILDAAMQLVRPGGRLVYSTCTFSADENEFQLTRIVEQNSSWRFAPSQNLMQYRSDLSDGCYRLWPHRNPCSGGFAGRIERTDDELFDESQSKERSRMARRMRETSRGHFKQEQSAISHLSQFGALSESLVARLWNGDILGTTQMGWDFIDRCPLKMFPPTLLALKGERWQPSHSMAVLRSALFNACEIYDVDDAIAGQFLAGHSIHHSTTDAKLASWVQIHWQSRPLGWAKCLSSRINNYLPNWAQWTPT